MQLADVGRNEPCPCGSGRKYKKCCLAIEDAVVAVDPATVAAVDRAIEDSDWEPLYDPIDAAMAVFEPGAPLEYVRFGEVQMPSRMPDTAEIAQLCSGGWLRRCEREIAYVLGRYPLAADERDGLRLAAYLLRRFGALSPTVDEIVKLQMDERTERLRRLATAISAQGLTLEAVISGGVDLRAWIERDRPTVLSFAQWFALRTAPSELVDELWSFNAAARIGEACLDRLEDPTFRDPRYWLELAAIVLLASASRVGHMLSLATAPYLVTADERAMHEAMVHKRIGEELPGIMHRILQETEDREDFADAALLRAAMRSVQIAWR
ncbi:MAG TPA: SEC-C metal-binding domain-containing protein [Kofleriaceae bacterium]